MTYECLYNTATHSETNCIFLDADKRVSRSSWKNEGFLYKVNDNGIIVYKNETVIHTDTFNYSYSPTECL